MDFLKKNKAGLTMIELLVVVTILAIFILMAFFAFKIQLMKGRDARRKADLAKLQRALEDRLNDAVCYPDELVCNTDFAPYLPKVPCDPLNNLYFNYFYSFNSTKSCKNWYKIYTKLENEKDPIIAKVGCANGCGPSNNYNYWIGSPNVTAVAQLSGEEWPIIPGAWPPGGGGVPTPSLEATPTPTEGVTPPPGASPTPTPSQPALPTPTPTPTPPLEGLYGCFSGQCRSLSFWCEPNFASWNCAAVSCFDSERQQPINECNEPE